MTAVPGSAAPPLPGVPDPPDTFPGAITLHTELLGDLQVPGGAGRAAELEALATRAALYATRAREPGTRRVYRSAWRGFEAWCRSLGREPLADDPEPLAMYATRRADQKVAVSTLRIDLAAIRTAHLLAGVPVDLRDPRLAMVVEGITRGRGIRPAKQAAPAVPDVLRLLLAACTPAGTALGRATAPCCCWASGRRCAARSWWRCGSATSSRCSAAACAFGCAAPRPTSTARRLRSGPTRLSRCSARDRAGCMVPAPDPGFGPGWRGRRPKAPAGSGRCSAP